MTDFFLKAKHWMLFIPIALPTLLSYFGQAVFSTEMQQWTNEMQSSGGEMDFTPPDLSDYSSYVYGYLLLLLVSGIVQLGWQWTMGNDLQDRVPEGTKLNQSAFQVTLAVSGLFLLLTCFAFFWGFDFVASNLSDWVDNPPGDEEGKALAFGFLKWFGLFMAFGLIAFGCQIYNVIHVGKTLKSIELGRPARGGEFAGYAILSYLLIIGVWILQPKVNRLEATGEMEAPQEGVW